jgi:MoxR-like ATPase
MSYRKFLRWDNERRDPQSPSPDDRSGAVYLEDPDLGLAAETAIVTQRPLLLRGEPGSGKSSFAPYAARNLGWRYYEMTVTGRTEARDLLWRFDALSRLRDAQAKEASVAPERYVTPGVLWWAFDADDARRFSQTTRRPDAAQANAEEPLATLNATRDEARAVVLIDEIDKADPDVPNDLLEVFGLHRFEVVDAARHPVARKAAAISPDPMSAAHFGSLLCVITTNNERELPAAFLRRCVVHRLEAPAGKEERVKRWSSIAQLHEGPALAKRTDGAALVAEVAGKCWELWNEADKAGRRGPSTAEFLDALRVCLRLDVAPDSPLWENIKNNVLLKDEAKGRGGQARDR